LLAFYFNLNHNSVRAAVETVESEAGVPAPESSSERATQEHMQCFHCGERCPDLSFVRDEKVFCCNGCLVVHDLLAENGLENFYSFTEHPGVRTRQSQREQWAYLDEPALQQRLLDFTDGKTSRVTFHIPAIHCVACVWLLENLFRLHPGIARSQVNFPRREVAIHFRPQSAADILSAGANPVSAGFSADDKSAPPSSISEKIKLSELVTLLASIGYEPLLTLNELEKRASDPARKRRWIQIGVAGFAFGNIMLFSLPQYFGLDTHSGWLFKQTFGYLSLVLAAPVVIYSALDYWKSALLSLRQRVLTLDVPITLGLAAIYSTSVFQVLTRTGEGYCDSLTGLIFFLLCGRAFQQKTHERIAFDRDYKSFFPLSVTRRLGRAELPLDQDSRQRISTGEEQVSLSDLQTGDHILLRNGELIPADSKLVSGTAMIDYSFVTGEAEPVAKVAGDYLYAGGKQIGSAIEVEIVKPVSQSYLMSLWNHETFQKNRDNNLNSLTNLYSRRFTLIVIAVAIGAAVFWIASGNIPRGIKAFASVLIVACPCALALAAPFTLGTTQRLLARRSVFVKNISVLERLARVSTIVFDKTGTLTAPTAASDIFHGEPLTENEQILVRSLARHSTHPYSQKIYGLLAGSGCEIETVASFTEIAGIGIKGTICGNEVFLGSRKWLELRGIEPARAPKDENVCLVINGQLRGSFAFTNVLRPETDQLLQQLSARYELALLSGDNEREREIFWSIFGSDNSMRFNQTPLDKLDFIRQLQKSGEIVMMVGDGLNDAGALKQSDVGVAVVEKIGAFSPASDVILEASRVAELDRILKFAQRSTQIVRLSFAISSLYNVVGVSIAAAGILSPIVCAVLMPLSSATVVLFAVGATSFAARGIFKTRRAQHSIPNDPETAALQVCATAEGA
jgi:Cu+-exporting ATPase